jgi:hypothetical protein
MDKILIVTIPAFVYYLTNVFNQSKLKLQEKKNKEIEEVNRLASIEIKKFKLEIINNLKDFKENLDKLNLILDTYNNKIQHIKQKHN